MKATLVERTATNATVRLTPGWIARLFGSTEYLVELHWLDDLKGQSQKRGWISLGGVRT